MSVHLVCSACHARYRDGEPSCRCERDWQIAGLCIVIMSITMMVFFVCLIVAYWTA